MDRGAWLKSLLQHHSSKASILQRSAFFTVQLSHPYMTTGKTIALTRRTFEALFHCAKPCGVPRGPANSTGSLASERQPGKFPKVPDRRRG